MTRGRIIAAFFAAALLQLSPSLMKAQIREGADSLILDLNIVDMADSLGGGDLQPGDRAIGGETRRVRDGRRERKEWAREADRLTFDDLHLDTVAVGKKAVINDYSMLGVQYGYGVASAMFNPSRTQRFILAPYNFGVTYTRYGKMFGYMPFFGIQAGAYYGTDGYRFKILEETGQPAWLESGADKAAISTVDGTVNAHCHVDFWKMKLIINLGYYIGYRIGVTRYRDGAVISTAFNDYDRRFDYGVKGGAGFGLVFDPVEIHIQATYKQSFQNIYDPDYNSSYYYRYAYPYSIVLSVGLHVQLTKRIGKTTRQIRQEAREAVFSGEQGK